MPDQPPISRSNGSEVGLQAQRAALRLGLWRASLASIAILLIVVGLALGVAWKAEQFQTEAARARAATARAESELWNSKLNEARARRMAGGPGARMQGAALVRELVQRRNLSEEQVLALRQEAIAQLALVDIEFSTNWIKEPQGLIFWNPSLTQYVYAESGGRILVRSYPEEEVLHTFHADTTNAVLQKAVFSPQGDLLAARFKDGEVRLWRLTNETLLLASRGTSSEGHSYPFFSPDGSVLGILPKSAERQRGDGLRLYDVQSRRVQSFPLAPTQAKFSPDGKHLAVLVDGQIQVLNLTNRQVDAGLDVEVGFYSELEWHPNGRRLAFSGQAGRLIVWDVWAGSKVKIFDGHPNQITFLDFSPDGAMLLTYGWDGLANLWDAVSGRRLLGENRAAITSFSITGDKVLAKGERGRRETVQRLLPRTGFRTVASTGNPAQATHGIWIHPSGRLIASAYPRHVATNAVCIWTFPEGELVAQLPGEWAQFTADGRAILAFQERVAVRRFNIPARLSNCGSAEGWEEEVIFRPGKGGTLVRGTLATDGRTLAIGENRYVNLLDLTGEKQPKRFKAPAQNASLSPNGQWVVTEKHQDYGYLLDASNGEIIRRLPPQIRTEFSPDGRYLIVLDEKALSVYQTNGWKLLRKIPLAVGIGTAPAFTFTPDGQIFALAHNRQDVRLFDSSTWSELATLANPIPIGGPAGLAFSADARWLLAARHDGDIIAWELPVVRAELAKLGLDWDQSRGEAAATSHPGVTPSVAGFTSASAPMVAFLAALLAIVAGSFIFIMQRRMLAGYGRIEAVALEQREKLQIAQAELLHSQKMRALGTLSAGIAHDFNNLLSVIRLSNQLAAEETKPSGQACENMQAIESAVAQGETIVQSMLGYSRAAAESEAEFSVGAALSETVAMLGRKFLAGIVLKLQVEPDLPLARGARGRLEQMLLNLVVNAAEAMNGQGTLELAARLATAPAHGLLRPAPAPNYIEVSVSDSGPGIPADVLPRVFEPFFTTKNAGATPGTGLGLSMVYTMAEQDGLGLDVETVQDRGTTFRLLIPTGRDKPSAQSSETSIRCL